MEVSTGCVAVLDAIDPSVSERSYRRRPGEGMKTISRRFESSTELAPIPAALSCVKIKRKRRGAKIS